MAAKKKEPKAGTPADQTAGTQTGGAQDPQAAQAAGAQSGGQQTGAGPAGDGAAAPARETRPYAMTTPEENEIILARSKVHPTCVFEEPYFIDLLQHSLSLSVAEKKRVVDAIPTLSQYQIDELTKVFLDEREEFRKLMDKEGDTIRDLAIKQSYGWRELIEIYKVEDQAKLAADADKAKEEELKKSMGL